MRAAKPLGLGSCTGRLSSKFCARNVRVALRGRDAAPATSSAPVLSSPAAPNLDADLVGEGTGIDPFSMDGVRITRIRSVMPDPKAVYDIPQQGLLPDPSPPPGDATDSGLGWSPDYAGLLMALSVMFAIRQGRVHSERDRFEAARGAGISSLAAKVPELKRAREAYLKEEAERKNRLADERMDEARRRAVEEKEERKRREAQYKAEAEREARRLQAQRESERQAFEEREKVMDEELAKRTEVEMRIREEQEAKWRAQEEERRRIEAERRAAEEAERQRLEEERRRQEEEERRRKAAEREALRKLERVFAVRLDVSLAVGPAAKGAMTDTKSPKPANIQAEVALSSALGGTSGPYAALFEETRDLSRRSFEALSAPAATDAVKKFAAAVRLQKMTGQGPLQGMDDLELDHWVRGLHVRTGISLGARLDRTAASRAGPAPPAASDSYQIRLERRCLPQDHPRNFANATRAVISLIEGGNETAARASLKELCEEQEAWLGQDVGDGVPRSSLPPGLGTALTLAHFLDRSWEERPSRTAEAPAWFERGAAIMRETLVAAVRGSLQDALTPTARAVAAALPEDHPVTKYIEELAERNLSQATRAARLEEARRLEEERMQRLVEEEWPDARSMAAARFEERENLTPVPERVWALRNVAFTLSLGGPGEVSKAREMQERAVSLLDGYLGSTEAPGLLSDTAMLAYTLGKNSEWADAEKATWGRLVGVCKNAAAVLRAAGKSSDADALSRAGQTLVMEAAARLADDDLLSSGRSLAVPSAATEAVGPIGSDGDAGSMLNGPQETSMSPEEAKAVIRRLGEKFLPQIETRKNPGAKKAGGDPLQALLGLGLGGSGAD